MCRWISYVADESILLEDLLKNPPHAIATQVNGLFIDSSIVNADGFGVAWYTDTKSEFDKKPDGGRYPALYRTTNAKPFNDTTFNYLCASTASKVILSHLRASSGSPVAATNNHPFVFGRNSFMHNGGIGNFSGVRRDMITKTSAARSGLIDGSTDTEHLAALYLTFLDDEPADSYFVSEDKKDEKKYSARSMFKALARAIQQVEQIQAGQNEKIINNGLNICATNGDNLVALCYRTNPWNPPATLFVSFTVADKINRKIGAPAGVSVDVGEFKEKVKVFTPEDIPNRPTSIVIASEPATFVVDDWRMLRSGEAILVDNKKGGSLNVEKATMRLARVATLTIKDSAESALTWLFNGHLYAPIDNFKHPQTISSALDPSQWLSWPELRRGVDAVLPNPNGERGMNFFCGESFLYVIATYQEGRLTLRVIQPPSVENPEIVYTWGCLRNAGFTRIEHAMYEIRGSNKGVWFFSGQQCILASVTQDSKGEVTESSIVRGPERITNLWASLKQVGFSTVNTMFRDPSTPDSIWVFSGVECALIRLDPNANPNVDTGDTLVKGPDFIKTAWPGLEAFYTPQVVPAPPPLLSQMPTIFPFIMSGVSALE